MLRAHRGSLVVLNRRRLEEEGARGVGESRLRLRAREDADGLVNGGELLRARTRPAGPLLRLGRAASLGLVEELLVRLQLQLRLRPLLLVLRKLHRVLALGLLRLDERGLEEAEVRALGLHELVMGLLRSRFLLRARAELLFEV